MSNNKISIIIVNFNGIKYLKNCLLSIKKEKYKNKEVILVDNNSVDNSVDEAKKIFPNLILIKNNKNLGFAQANNQGVTRATGEYVFLLNNDTIISDNLFSPLVDYLKNNPKVGIVQPKVLLIDNPKILDSIGSFYVKTGFLYHYAFEREDDKKYDHTIELFSAKGCAMLIRKKIIDKISLFDNDYFAYFEETDFCWRTWLTGYKIIYFPFVSIFHKGSFTSSKMNQSFIIFHSFKNRINSLIKNLELKNLIPTLLIHFLLVIIMMLGYLLKLKFSYSMAILKSIYWNIVNLRLTIRKRKTVQNLRIVKDNEFLPKLSRKTNFLYYYFLFRGKLKNIKFDLQK